MCTATLIEEVSQVEWEIVPKDPALQEAPPEDILDEIDVVKDFLNNPNPNKGETINTIMRAATRDSLELDALSLVKGFSQNSYLQHPAGGWELKPQGQRELVEIFGRDGGSFLKETDVDGIEYRYWQYSYLHPAVAPIEFATDEIVYGMRYWRTYSSYGWAETQSAETILNLLINSAFSNATMFQDYSVPSGIVSFTGSPEDEDRLREYWRTEIKGRFHKVAVLNKDAKFVPLAYTNRDLEFLEGQKWFSRLMWALYKLTPSELGFTEDEVRKSGAALSAQGKIQKRKGVVPLIRLWEQTLNNQVINEFSPRIMFKFKDVDKEEEMAQDELYLELGKQGFVLPNEWRKKRKWSGPSPFGEMPIDIAKALIAAGSKPGGQPQEQIPTGPSEGFPQEMQRPKLPPGKAPPMSAEEKSLYEVMKAWGGNPNQSWDFADKNDRATPIFTRDHKTGRIIQVAESGHRDSLSRKERKQLLKSFSINDDTEERGFKVSPQLPQDRMFNRLRGLFPNLNDAQIIAKVNEEVRKKQYAQPRARKIGPYAGQGRGVPYPMGAMGNRPDEPIRRGELLPGENPEEIQRARESGSPLRPWRGLGEEDPPSPEELGDVTRQDPRLGPPGRSGIGSHKWERENTHTSDKVGPLHTRADQSTREIVGHRREPTDPVHDVNTETQFIPIEQNRADANNPRKPTPTIPRGPKYPKDVPPIQQDTGALGAMQSTGPDKKKPQKILSAQTGATGPQHQETLGFLEREGPKYKSYQDNPHRYRQEFMKEHRDHPELPLETIAEIVNDHLGGEPKIKAVRDGDMRENFEGRSTYSFDDTGRMQFAQTMGDAGYVERPEFRDADLSKGYFCGSCGYMQQNPKSPTGYVCTKFNFPDRPWGCSDGWEMKPELRKKTVAVEHGHAPFKSVTTTERALYKQLGAILTRLHNKQLTRSLALELGKKAIDEQHIRLCDHARKQLTKGVLTLSPEQSQRLDEWRSKTVEHWKAVVDDTK